MAPTFLLACASLTAAINFPIGQHSCPPHTLLLAKAYCGKSTSADDFARCLRKYSYDYKRPSRGGAPRKIYNKHQFDCFDLRDNAGKLDLMLNEAKQFEARKAFDKFVNGGDNSVPTSIDDDDKLFAKSPLPTFAPTQEDPAMKFKRKMKDYMNKGNGGTNEAVDHLDDDDRLYHKGSPTNVGDNDATSEQGDQENDDAPNDDRAVSHMASDNEQQWPKQPYVPKVGNLRRTALAGNLHKYPIHQDDDRY